MDAGSSIGMVHGAGHRRRKHIGVVRVELVLPDQQVDRLLGDHYRSDGVPGLRRAYPQFAIAAQDGFAHGDRVSVRIKVSPEERKQLSPPQAAGQLQIKHRQDIAVRRRLEVCADLLRLDNLHLFFLDLGRVAVVGRILLDEFLLDCLLQRTVQHHMDTPDGLRTQSGVVFVLMHFSVGAKLLVQLLEPQAGQLVQRYIPNSGDQMVLNEIAIIFLRCRPDIGLGIEIIPGLQPLPYCEFGGSLYGLCGALPGRF